MWWAEVQLQDNHLKAIEIMKLGIRLLLTTQIEFFRLENVDNTYFGNILQFVSQFLKVFFY